MSSLDTVNINLDNCLLPDLCQEITLTLKHWETHGCVVSIVATDALVLKHQVISILNAD